MKGPTNILNIGQSGLFSSQKKLTTTAHNMANVNTEGFSRQRASQQATDPYNYGKIILGSGTKVARVERLHDKYLEKNLGNSITDHQFYKERDFQLEQIEEIFNEIKSPGFNNLLSKFFNSFRELSMRPDDKAIRSVVRENAKQLINNLKNVKIALNRLQFNMDERILNAVYDINLLTHQIGKLNVKIANFESEGGETGDLRDQRDSKIRELSKFLNIRVYEDNHERYSINADGIGSLVAGGHVQELVAQKSSDSDAHIPGGVEIYLQKNTTLSLSNKLSKGSLRAIFDSRNNELKFMQNHVDELTYGLARSVNSIHRMGFANKEFSNVDNEIQRGIASSEKVTGIDFFNLPPQQYRASETIDLSDEVKEDLKNIVSAWEPNSPGDNRIAIAIANLQNEKMFDENTSNIQDFYLKAIGRIGVKAKAARVNNEHSFGILSQNKALKERVSGVSLDEETANMIRFQHAFDASARVMSVADEMFKTVLGIKKL
ncbi:MAG: flagellar hook-associated protein FlgK [Bacteriovoracales bacterium]|nr:flagellar hook-associated protein FlgK [Bacteriovoracales bacterium]